MVRSAHRAFTVAAVVSAALVVASVVLHFTVDVPEPVPVLRLAQGPGGDLITGPIYIIAGLIAWRRRPDNRIGPMMVILGDTIVFPWAVGAAGTLGFTLAAAVDDISPVIGLLTFLSFPDRAARRPARANRRRRRPRRLRRADRVRAAVSRPDRGRVRRLPGELALAPNAAIADAVVAVVQLFAVLVVSEW